MEHRTCIRSTNAQINFLINYMSSHKEFANGTSSSPVGNAQWSYLRELLKQHGPDKSIDQWKTTWRDLKRKARKQKADVCAQAMAEEFHEVPVVSGSTIKVLDTIGDEIAPECKVEIRAMKSPVREMKYVTMRRRRRLLQPPPGPAPGRDLLQAQNQRNALLQKLCDLVAEQNSILRERNQIERRKMYNRNRR